VETKGATEAARTALPVDRVGRGSRRRRSVVWLLLGAVACSRPASCSEAEGREEPPATEAPPHVDEPAHEALPTIVKLPETVLRDAHVRTLPVAREVLPITLALPGEIVADPDRTARLSSPIPGRIEDVRFQEGATVKRGDVLAVIAVPDLGRLRSEQVATLARARAARTNAERLKELLGERLTSEQLYRDAVANAEALEVEARAATERLGALGLADEKAKASSLTLRAPIAGVVVVRNAVVGQPVGADEVLCSIVDLSEAWFLGRVFEKDLGRLASGASAEIQLNAYPDARFEGPVEYIGRQVDPVARTLTARIRLHNRDERLRVGLFGTAYVSTADAGERGPTLVVPRSALTEVGGRQVVFVRHADGDFELHGVVTGASAAGKVEVLSGLRDGEQVVVDGVFTLKSAVLKSTFAEEEE